MELISLSPESVERDGWATSCVNRHTKGNRDTLNHLHLEGSERKA